MISTSMLFLLLLLAGGQEPDSSPKVVVLKAARLFDGKSAPWSRWDGDRRRARRSKPSG